MSEKELKAMQMAKATRITIVQPGQPLASLVDALRARNWGEAAKQIEHLQRSMSLKMTEEERTAFADAVKREMETAVLLDSGPPAAPMPVEVPTEENPEEPRQRHRKRLS